MAEDQKELTGYLEFTVGTHPYAIPISTVKEINQVGEITPVPRAATQVCGVMNLRGQVLPVIDLHVRLHGQVNAKTRMTVIIVIQTPEGDAGLMVDSVARVTNLSSNQVSAAPQACHLSDSSLVAAVAHDGERTITILKMDRCARPFDMSTIRALPPIPEPTETDASVVAAALKLLD